MHLPKSVLHGLSWVPLPGESIGHETACHQCHAVALPRGTFADLCRSSLPRKIFQFGARRTTRADVRSTAVDSPLNNAALVAGCSKRQSLFRQTHPYPEKPHVHGQFTRPMHELHSIS